MNQVLRNQKGITLAALVITIIVILILAGIGIGTMTGARENIQKSKSSIAISDLTQIQQAVMENYIKYKQTGNERLLKGIQTTYSDAENYLASVDSTINLKGTVYSEITGTDPGLLYYKLQDWHLSEMGLENVGTDEYIVNYSTGEVFDITNSKTANGEILYIYAK